MQITVFQTVNTDAAALMPWHMCPPGAIALRPSSMPPALTRYIYVIQIRAELAELPSNYCIAQIVGECKNNWCHNTSRRRELECGGPVWYCWHCLARFMSYKSVQNWQSCMHIITVLIFRSTLAVCKNMPMPRHISSPADTFWRSSSVPPALFIYIYSTQIFTELNKLHSHDCISQIVNRMWRYTDAWHMPTPAPIFWQLSRVSPALSCQIYSIQIGWEWARLHSRYCILQGGQYPKMYWCCGTSLHLPPDLDSPIRCRRHCQAIFILYKSVQNWLSYIQITILPNVSCLYKYVDSAVPHMKAHFDGPAASSVYPTAQWGAAGIVCANLFHINMRRIYLATCSWFYLTT